MINLYDKIFMPIEKARQKCFEISGKIKNFCISLNLKRIVNECVKYVYLYILHVRELNVLTHKRK